MKKTEGQKSRDNAPLNTIITDYEDIDRCRCSEQIGFYDLKCSLLHWSIYDLKCRLLHPNQESHYA
jgi:hypothetical protein